MIENYVAVSEVLIPEVPKKLPEGFNKDYFLEVVQTDKILEDAFVELLVASDDDPDLLLGKPLLVEKEVGHRFRGHLDQTSLLEKLQSLACVKIELLERVQKFFFVFAFIWRPFFPAIEVCRISHKG